MAEGGNIAFINGWLVPMNQSLDQMGSMLKVQDSYQSHENIDYEVSFPTQQWTRAPYSPCNHNLCNEFEPNRFYQCFGQEDDEARTAFEVINENTANNKSSRRHSHANEGSQQNARSRRSRRKLQKNASVSTDVALQNVVEACSLTDKHIRSLMDMLGLTGFAVMEEASRLLVNALFARLSRCVEHQKDDDDRDVVELLRVHAAPFIEKEAGVIAPLHAALRSISTEAPHGFTVGAIVAKLMVAFPAIRFFLTEGDLRDVDTKRSTTKLHNTKGRTLAFFEAYLKIAAGSLLCNSLPTYACPNDDEILEVTIKKLWTYSG